MLRLIKLWLKAPIEERDEEKRDPAHQWWQEQRMRHASRRRREPDACQHLYEPVPEVLAADQTRESVPRTRRRYADDFVILSRGCAAEVLAWTKVVMTRLGLAINEVKTSLKNARQERFDFLGYSFGPHRYKANGLWYLSASPSKKSVHRLKTKVGNLLVPGNNDPWPEVRDTLNRSLLGWSNYFCHGTCRSAFRGVDQYVYERVRGFLARRHKMAGRGTKRFSRMSSMENVDSCA